MSKLFFKSAGCIFLASVFMISGCQPTPAKPVVVNKADGKLEEKMQETPAPKQPYEAPAHWSETVEGEKINIVIDADVTLPGVTAYPVVKLEPASFTQQQVDDMVHYFVDDAKLYLPHVMTKADYDEEIVLAKRGQEMDGEFVVTEDSKAWVKELEKMRDAAPADSPIIYIDSTLAYMKDEFGNDDKEKGKNFLSACFKNADGSEGSVSASNYAEGFTSASRFSYSQNHDFNYISEAWYLRDMESGMTEEDLGWMGVGELFDKVTMAEQDAQAMAEKAIDDLGIKDMMLVSAERAVSKKMPDKGGYQLTYARQSGGLPLFWFTGGGHFKDEEPPQYSPPFSEEHLEIWVNEDGIFGFYWNGYAKVTETVSDNIELLPFEDIQEALKKQITYKKSFIASDDPNFSNLTVTITSAELRMGYIGVKDTEYQALMVPVWVFESTFGYDNAYSEKGRCYPDDEYVLNAIDGGVIEMKRHEFKDAPAD